MRCEGVLILKWMALICSVIPVIGQAVCIQLRFSLSRLCVLRVSRVGPYPVVGRQVEWGDHYVTR